jgi:hypothetical protein
MTITKEDHLYEIMLRLNPDGSVRGAHQANLERLMDGETVISEREMPAVAIDPDDIAGLIGANSAEMIAQVTRLQAERDDAVSALEAAESRIAELTASVDGGSRRIAGAYFRSALIEMELIDTVLGAIADPVKLELFNTATEFNDQDADVKAIAAALDIDLSAVFDAAEAIRAGRG